MNHWPMPSFVSYRQDVPARFHRRVAQRHSYSASTRKGPFRPPCSLPPRQPIRLVQRPLALSFDLLSRPFPARNDRLWAPTAFSQLFDPLVATSVSLVGNGKRKLPKLAHRPKPQLSEQLCHLPSRTHRPVVSSPHPPQAPPPIRRPLHVLLTSSPSIRPSPFA